MSGEFDIDAAVTEISGDLGFEIDTSEVVDDPVLNDLATDHAPIADPAVDTPAPQLDPAPVTWRKEAQEAWANLPEVARKEVLKREQDIMQGLEQYKTHAHLGKGFRSAIDPYQHLLSQHNIDPIKQVGQLLNAHFTLATGTPEQKAALFQTLARDYQIDIGSLTDPAPFLDPAVQNLQSQLQSVQSKLSERESREAADKQATYEREVSAFAADPKNFHFEAAAPFMAKLLQSKQASTLQEAYDMAVWANPVTRAAEIERQQTVQLEATRKEAEAKTAQAKAAMGAQVRTTPKSGSRTASLGSMDDTLEATLREITSRS